MTKEFESTQTAAVSSVKELSNLELSLCLANIKKSLFGDNKNGAIYQLQGANENLKEDFYKFKTETTKILDDHAAALQSIKSSLTSIQESMQSNKQINQANQTFESKIDVLEKSMTRV